MFKLVVFTSFFLLFIVPDFYAQDTLLLFNNTAKIGKIIETGKEHISIINNKSKLLRIEKNKIYSIKYSNNKEEILNYVDTLILVNNKRIPIHYSSLSNGYVKYRKISKQQIELIDKIKVFKIKPQIGEEIIVQELDKINFMNTKSLFAQIKEVNDKEIIYFKAGSIKEKKVKRKKVFSIQKFLSLEEIITPVDTLILIDRPYKFIDVVELNDSMLVYAKPGKRRLKYIERDKAYSIRGTNKEEQIIYIIDTLEGNYVSAWDMKYYIEGQLDALHGYKGKANKIAASGVVFGASGSVLGLFYGPIAPTLYIIFQSTKKVRAKPKHNFNADKVQDDMYVLGYNTMARRMTMKKLYWTTLSGYAIGLATYTILFGGK